MLSHSCFRFLYFVTLLQIEDNKVIIIVSSVVAIVIITFVSFGYWRYRRRKRRRTERERRKSSLVEQISPGNSLSADFTFRRARSGDQKQNTSSIPGTVFQNDDVDLTFRRARSGNTKTYSQTAVYDTTLQSDDVPSASYNC